jgi:DNA-binding response OmpR family regulator
VTARWHAVIMIVEDDEEIGQALDRALQVQGYETQFAPDAATAMTLAEDRTPDLVLLDLGLPDLDGVVLCRQLRRRLPDAILVALTARDSEIDVVIGLDAGADDYLTKPFRLTELIARIRAHLRRRPGTAIGKERLVSGAVTLDLDAHRCLVHGSEIPLRPKEFNLLAILMAAAGTAVSRGHLMTEIWDPQWYGSTKTLDMHVSWLRRKLADAGESPDRLVTVRGFGYRYEGDSPFE